MSPNNLVLHSGTLTCFSEGDRVHTSRVRRGNILAAPPHRPKKPVHSKGPSSSAVTGREAEESHASQAASARFEGGQGGS